MHSAFAQSLVWCSRRRRHLENLNAPRRIKPYLVAAIALACSGPAQAVLQARDLTGDSVTDAYYDTDLNITWLANANANVNAGNGVSGLMTWSQANTWAGNLIVGADNDWRLPSTTPGGDGSEIWTNGGTNCGYNVDPGMSEMAHLFHVTFGYLSLLDSSGALRSGSAGVDWGARQHGAVHGAAVQLLLVRYGVRADS